LIVIPAFNEGDSLPATLKELRKLLPDEAIVVVDDGSSDGTAAVARRAGAAVVQLPFNLGVGGAVRAGLRYAQEHDVDRAVILDADGQHDPAGIATLLEALERGADMVIGSRFGADLPEAYPVSRGRRQAMRFLAFIVRGLTGQRFSDVTSGFRAFDRQVIELFAREYPAEYLADTVEALLIARYAGLRVVEVPIAMRPRAYGHPSTRRLRLVVNYLRLVVGILGSASRRARRQTVEP
jgi:glycosyltransferase involved in cell wall biosynthesis